MQRKIGDPRSLHVQLYRRRVAAETAAVTNKLWAGMDMDR